MFDPETLAYTDEATVKLPRLVTVNDYHEFGYYQQIFNNDLGMSDVYVTEVGFHDGQYIGLVHLDIENHNQLVLQLENYYKELEDQ
jgi:hypothetical protein